MGRLASAHVDELAGGRWLIECDVVAIAADVFDHDDAVRAIWNWCSGHDLDGFSAFDGAIEASACADLTDDANAAGHIGGAHGESIASGAIERGVIAIGAEVLSQYAPVGCK